MIACAPMPRKLIFMPDAKNNRGPFSAWLFSARKAHGLTQEGLSELSGIDQGLISKYERSIFTPAKREIVISLADALMIKGSDDRVNRSLLNAGLKAAGFAPADAEPGGPLETIVQEAGYSADDLDEDGLRQLRQSVDAVVIGIMEQEKRKKASN